MTPAMCGAAMDVPLRMVPCDPVPASVEKIPCPGAEMSGLRPLEMPWGPRDVNVETVSASPSVVSQTDPASALVIVPWSVETVPAARNAAVGRELRKGPRGGGRELDKIVDHVLGAEGGYLAQLGWKPSKEEAADQERAVRLAEGSGEPDALKWARHHRDVIARFGRFPHRNAAVGRESTPDEQEWLAEGGGF